MMGYFKHFNGRLKDESLYVGWVDSKSGEPVDDKDVKNKLLAMRGSLDRYVFPFLLSILY
jgi:3-oxoacyl-ACP reductase-like protein